MKIVTIAIVAIVAVLIYAYRSDWLPKQPATENQNGIDRVQPLVPDLDGSADDLEVASATETTVAPVNLTITSVYGVDRDLRDAAVSEAEKIMDGFSEHSAGVVRWEPVIVDSSSIVIGDFLSSDGVAEEFTISPFTDVTFTAEKTDYRSRAHSRSATWEGELTDDSNRSNGTVVMTMQSGRAKPVLILKMRTETRSYVLLATDIPDAYVSIEMDPYYWRKVRID